MLNPDPGKPVSAGTHHPGADVGEVIAVAMQHVLPDRAVPQTYKTGIPTIIVGVDPRTGATFTDHSAEVYAGWCNASKGMDAWGALNASFGNLWKATAEINESLYPHVQWSRDYRTDSGGPGQWRGICGSHYEKEVRVDAEGLHVRRRHEVPDAGHLRRQERRAQRDDPPLRQRRRVPGRRTPPTGCRSHAGERIMFDYGGGGGWGDPLDRDPQAVLDDVLDEYVSVEGARRDYGVVLTGSLEDLTLAIDDDAHRTRLRDRMRAAETRACMMGYRVGVDVGGTFTDLICVTPERRDRARQDADARSTTSRRGVMNGLEQLAERFGLDARRVLPRPRHPRARHDHRRQHDDRDERRATRACSSPKATATRSSCAAATRKRSGTRTTRARSRSRAAGARIPIRERMDFEGDVLLDARRGRGPPRRAAAEEARRRVRSRSCTCSRS